jgi:transposase-like protein
MPNTKNQRYSESFKFKVALAAIQGTKTINELCDEFGIVSSQLYAWKHILEKSGPEVFTDKRRTESKDQDEIKCLNVTIEKQKDEIDFLECVLKNSTQKYA